MVKQQFESGQVKLKPIEKPQVADYGSFAFLLVVKLLHGYFALKQAPVKCSVVYEVLGSKFVKEGYTRVLSHDKIAFGGLDKMLWLECH